MNKEIRKQGARAAAMGVGLTECPFFRLSHLPGTTNETLHAWRKRVEAWETGWHEFHDQRAHIFA